MTILNLYSHFEGLMEFFGFKEHEDAFNIENIGSSLLERAYHVNIPTIIGGAINQHAQDTSSTVVINFFVKGFRYPKDAKIKAVEIVDQLIRKACNITDRTSGLLNVVFDSSDFDFIASSNDNIVKVEMRFTAEVVIDVEEKCIENCLNI